MEDKRIDIDAIPGERWFPKETNFEDDIKEYWGDWGVSSEVETLRAVLMRRPGKEIENFNAKEVRFSDDPVDVELMRKQHDDVVKIYKDFGVDVYYVENQREDRPNAIFCRDLVLMTPIRSSSVFTCSYPLLLQRLPVDTTQVCLSTHIALAPSNIPSPETVLMIGTPSLLKASPI